MKLLITGGAGYIGSHVVLHALKRGYKVAIFDDLSTGLEENIFYDAKFIYGSVNSLKKLNNVLKNGKFDAVIHLASSKSVEESKINPSKYADNITGSLNLIKACIENNVRTIIFSSSASVYGMPQYLPVDEQHPRSPINYYGYTKLVIEDSLMWFNKLTGIQYGILRYFNASGYDSAISGIEIRPKNLIPIIMEVGFGIKKELKIFGENHDTPDGTGVRDFVHVNDLAKAHLNVIEYIENNNKCILINLGNEIGISVKDVVKRSQKIFKEKILYRYVAKREGDPPILVAKSNLARELINWEPQESGIDNILKSTWAAYNRKMENIK